MGSTSKDLGLFFCLGRAITHIPQVRVVPMRSRQYVGSQVRSGPRTNTLTQDIFSHVDSHASTPFVGHSRHFRQGSGVRAKKTTCRLGYYRRVFHRLHLRHGSGGRAKHCSHLRHGSGVRAKKTTCRLGHYGRVFLGLRLLRTRRLLGRSRDLRLSYR